MLAVVWVQGPLLYLGLPPSAVTAADDDSERGDAEGGEGESDGGKESDGNFSGGEAESGGGTLIGISEEGDSGVLGWFSNHSESDHSSVIDPEVGFEVEGFMGGVASRANEIDKIDTYISGG